MAREVVTFALRIAFGNICIPEFPPCFVGDVDSHGFLRSDAPYTSSFRKSKQKSDVRRKTFSHRRARKGITFVEISATRYT
jgi:hypothetical protein